MRKGLWSPDEDERLVRCITKYVNGSWSDIARKAGLDRCGKSCRRRWMNHLRPDLKRGKFSMDEIGLIVQLQETLGNRWSDIASHLEGRTDNDVKNLWNTQIKKRLSQLKSHNLSSLPIHFSSIASNSSAFCNPTSINADTNDFTNMGFMHNAVDDHENGNIILRFGGANPNGSMVGQEYSCSASSCEGSDQLNLNDQDNSSLKRVNTDILSSSTALTLPHADLRPPIISDTNDHFLWGNMQGNHLQTFDHTHQSEAKLSTAASSSYAHSSLLMNSCSSSSSNIMMRLGVPFLQPSQLHLLPAADERAMASCVGDLFDLQLQDSTDQACAATSLGSSSYLPARIDSCTLGSDVNEADQWCSLQRLCTVPSTLNHAGAEQLHNQVTKNKMSTDDHILFAENADHTINCSPSSKIVYKYCIDDKQLQQKNSQCSSSSPYTVAENIVSENNTERITDKSTGIIPISKVEELELQLPAEALMISGRYYTTPEQSTWGAEDGQIQDLRLLHSSLYMSSTLVGATGGAAGGWDDPMREDTTPTSSMPHFSIPDWCKHLLQNAGTDLL